MRHNHLRHGQEPGLPGWRVRPEPAAQRLGALHDYLRKRLGGTIEKVAGIVEDQPLRYTLASGAMSDSERQKVRYWRGKMLKAGVADVRLLPASKKLSVREVALTNATFQKLTAEMDQPRRAA